MRKRRFLILGTILFMAIAFAAVTTTLVMSGTATIGAGNFDVYFSEVKIDNEDMSDSAISSNGKSVVFETNSLKQLDQTSEVAYEITNASKQYDAEVSVTCRDETEDKTNLNDYLDIIYPDSNSVIPARQKGNGSIQIRLKRSTTEEIRVSIACELNVEATEREKIADASGPTNPDDPDNPSGEEKYGVSGYVINEKRQILPNTNLVIYSATPNYVTTNEEGYFSIDTLEQGSHEAYLMVGYSIDELKNMKKEDHVKNATSMAEFTTSSRTITFINGYKIVKTKPDNREFVITFNPNGGEVSPTTKKVRNGDSYGELPTPTLKGYTFKGWYTNTDFTTPITSAKGVKLEENQTLYAKWEANSYTITFDSDGGSKVADKNIKYNASYGDLPTPTKEGYTFEGWYLGENKITSIMKFTSLNNITLKAKWKKKEVTIIVDINGTPTEVPVDPDKPLIETLPEPEKPGYDFDGWCLDEACTQKVDESTKLPEDGKIDLHPNYTPKKYAVVFDANGGQTPTLTKDVTYDSTYGELPTPTKTGYNFVGWFTANEGGNQVTSETKVSITATQTLYARWSAKSDITYTVKHWQQNVGALDVPKNESNYTLIDTETLNGTTGENVSPNVKTYTGFTAPAKETTTIKADGSAVVNYYYTRNSYTLTINKDTGVDSLSNKTSYQYGEEVSLSYTIKPGYTFKDITGDKTISTFTMPASNVTLSINTTENTYTITYNLNGGTNNANNPSSYKVTSNDITIQNPTKTGYNFTGWEGTSGTTIPMGSTGNKTYTAKWEPKTFTVSFDANGGNSVATILTVTYDSTYGSTLPTPTKNGYTFNGWYTAASGGSQVINTTKVSITANQTLYAHWTVKSYTINYTLDGGTAGANKPTSATYDQVVTISNPTKTGYTFAGWTVTSGLNTSTAKYGTSNTTVTSAISSTSTKVTAQYFKNLTTGTQVTLTANWTAKSYAVTLKANTGGSVSTLSVNVTYGTSNTFNVTPSSGYYLSDLSCTNGYTTDAKTGTSSTSAQKVKVSNNYIDATSACTASFKESGIKLTTYVTNLAATDTTNLAYDDTADKNLRYIGSNPNNYVSFNGELWRIIGIMNNVPDFSGNKASRIKLIRAESIGEIEWNTNYENNWKTSSLQKLLNSGDYYNRLNTYKGNGLTDAAKSMISNIKWNLGGWDTEVTSANMIYTQERRTLVSSERPTTWDGYVGLMYPSDYGYAVGGNVRSTCLSTSLTAYKDNNCQNNDWLYLSSTYQWTLTPNSINGYLLFRIENSGNLYYNNACYAHVVRPVVYLNTDILKVGGTGSKGDPYQLSK